MGVLKGGSYSNTFIYQGEKTPVSRGIQYPHNEKLQIVHFFANDIGLLHFHFQTGRMDYITPKLYTKFRLLTCSQFLLKIVSGQVDMWCFNYSQSFNQYIFIF